VQFVTHNLDVTYINIAFYIVFHIATFITHNYFLSHTKIRRFLVIESQLIQIITHPMLVTFLKAFLGAFKPDVARSCGHTKYHRMKNRWLVDARITSKHVCSNSQRYVNPVSYEWTYKKPGLPCPAHDPYWGSRRAGAASSRPDQDL